MALQVQELQALGSRYREIARSLLELESEADALVQIYFKLNLGGLEGTDAAWDEIDLTPSQVSSLITALQQFGNFLGNVAVSQGDYAASLTAAQFGSNTTG